MASALDYLRQLLGGGDQEAAGAAQASTAMQPAVLQYLQDMLGDTRKRLSGQSYDPRQSFAQNALDPQGIDQATSVAMSAGPGVIRAAHGFGPIYHRTTSDIKDLSQFDISKASPSAVWGPGVYASLDGGSTWAPPGTTGRVLSGRVTGDIIDLTKPLPAADQTRINALVGRETEGIPFITLERRFGSVAAGLKEAGYSGALHEGPGGKNTHIVVFDPANIIPQPPP